MKHVQTCELQTFFIPHCIILENIFSKEENGLLCFSSIDPGFVSWVLMTLRKKAFKNMWQENADYQYFLLFATLFSTLQKQMPI